MILCKLVPKHVPTSDFGEYTSPDTPGFMMLLDATEYLLLKDLFRLYHISANCAASHKNCLFIHKPVMKTAHDFLTMLNGTVIINNIYILPPDEKQDLIKKYVQFESMVYKYEDNQQQAVVLNKRGEVRIVFIAESDYERLKLQELGTDYTIHNALDFSYEFVNSFTFNQLNTEGLNLKEVFCYAFSRNCGYLPQEKRLLWFNTNYRVNCEFWDGSCVSVPLSYYKQYSNLLKVTDRPANF